MPESDPDVYLVVAGPGDRAVVDAVREVRDEAARRAAPAAATVLVGSERRATAVRHAVADLSLPDSVSLSVVVATDPAATVRDRVVAGGVVRVVVDPAVGLTPDALDDVDAPVERLATDRAVRRRRLVHDRGLAGFLTTFVLSYGFYLLLGDPTDPFDLVTGAVTAGVVAAALSAVVVETEPSVRGVLARSARAAVFLPYLGYEIVKANLGVAYVILHPDLPIDPAFVEYDPETEGRFERAVLANAITLTPGTLTVDADGERFLVHVLTPATRAGLEAGSLRRAVAWVFHGSGS